MMIKRTMGFLFCFLSTIATAQETPAVEVKKTVTCSDTTTVLKNIQELKWEEKPLWVGSTKESAVSLFINEKTGTWTIVQFNETVACLIEVGEKSRFLLGGSI